MAIQGGRLVLEAGVREGDLLVEDGRIAAILAPGTARAGEVVDARGLVVFPGAVDAHVHCNEPGRTEWEGFAAATRGAAAGGTTTLVDMPLNSIPPTLDGSAVAAKRRALERSAVVDVALWGGLAGADPRPLEELRDSGVVGVKAFMSDPGVPEFPRLDDTTLRAGLREAARLGLLVGVHAEDEAMTRERAERLRADGRTDPEAWLESRPPEAEVAAVRRLVAFARESDARIHLLHASAVEAVDELRAARESGLDATVETCTHYLLYAASDLRRLGPLLKCAPPLRDTDNREQLWRRLLAGALDLVASDHSPSAATLKAGDIWTSWGGVSGVQSLLSGLLSEGVHRRGLSLRRLAWLVATGPARRLGLYPRKGALRSGSHADVALIDLDQEWTLEPAALQARSGLSPYVGRRFRGRVVRTIVRGRTVFREGEIVAEPGYGRFESSIGPSWR